MVGLVVFGCSVYVCVACITIASRPGWMWMLLCGVLVLSHLPTDTQVLSSYMAVALAFLATAATLVANIYLPGKSTSRDAHTANPAAPGDDRTNTADRTTTATAIHSAYHGVAVGSAAAARILHGLHQVLSKLRRWTSIHSDASWPLLTGRSDSASGSSRSSGSLEHASSFERALSQACRSIQAEQQPNPAQEHPVPAVTPVTQGEIQPEPASRAQPQMTSAAASRLVQWVASTSGVKRQSSESAPCGPSMESSQVATILGGDTTSFPAAAPSAPSVICESRSAVNKRVVPRPGSASSSEVRPIQGPTSTHLAASLTMSRQSSLSSIARSAHMAATPSGRSHAGSVCSLRQVSPQQSNGRSPRGPAPRPVQPTSQQQGQPWSGVPEAIFQQVLTQLAPPDIMNVRLACRDWFRLCSACLTVLQPSQLHPSRLSMLFPHLQQLDLSGVTQAVRPSALRQVLCQLRGLQELRLGCSDSSSGSSGTAAASCGHAAPLVGDRCMLEVAQQAPGHPKLRSLGLANCMRISDSGLVALASLTSLTSIQLSGCVSITDVGILLLTQLPLLASLDLAWCLKTSNAGLKALGGAAATLTQLDISGCPLVTEVGLASLSTLTHLRHLAASHMGLAQAQPALTDHVMAAWSGLTQLEHLAVGAMQPGVAEITDGSLMGLPLNHPQLSHLEISCLCLITDAGLLAAVAGLHDSLASLTLRHCHSLTSACLPALSNLPQLQVLELLGCTAIELSSQQLLKLLPGINLALLDQSGSGTTKRCDITGTACYTAGPTGLTPGGLASNVGALQHAAPSGQGAVGQGHGAGDSAVGGVGVTGHGAIAAAMSNIQTGAELDTEPLLPASWEFSSSIRLQAPHLPSQDLTVIPPPQQSAGSSSSTASAAVLHDDLGSAGASQGFSSGPVASAAMTMSSATQQLAGSAMTVMGDEGDADGDGFLLPLPPVMPQPTLPAPPALPAPTMQALKVPSSGSSHSSSPTGTQAPSSSTAGVSAHFPSSVQAELSPAAGLDADVVVGAHAHVKRVVVLPLRTLALGNLAAGQAIQATDDSCLAVVSQLHSTLESLTLGNFVGSLATPTAAHALAKLTALTALELHGCTQIMDSGLVSLAGAAFASRLQRLSLVAQAMGNQWTPSGLRGVMSACTALTQLTLRGCGASLSNEVVWQIGKSLTRLTSLTITHSPTITDLGLRTLSNLQQLANLEISCCDRITAHGLFDGPPAPRAPIQPQFLQRQTPYTPLEAYRYPHSNAPGMYMSSTYVRAGPDYNLPLYSSTAYGAASPGAAGTSMQHSLQGGPAMAAEAAYHQLHGSVVHGQGMHGQGLQGSGLHGQGMNGQGVYGATLHGSGLHGPGLQGPGLHGPGLQWSGVAHQQAAYQHPAHQQGYQPGYQHLGSAAYQQPSSWQGYSNQGYQQPGYNAGLAVGYQQPGPSAMHALHAIQSSALPTMVHMRHLRAVSLACTSVDELGVRTLCRHAPSITHLDLSECVFIDDDAVKALVSLKLLVSLDLSQCSRLGDVSLSYLATLTHLATLRLSGCVRLSDEGVAYLTNLPLLMLHMDKCIRITDAGMHQLSHVPSLTSLRLARCPEISDQGVAALARLTRLSTLSLAHNERITDTGLMALARITCLAVLEI